MTYMLTLTWKPTQNKFTKITKVLLLQASSLKCHETITKVHTKQNFHVFSAWQCKEYTINNH